MVHLRNMNMSNDEKLLATALSVEAQDPVGRLLKKIQVTSNEYVTIPKPNNTGVCRVQGTWDVRLSRRYSCIVRRTASSLVGLEEGCRRDRGSIRNARLGQIPQSSGARAAVLDYM